MSVVAEVRSAAEMESKLNAALQQLIDTPTKTNKKYFDDLFLAWKRKDWVDHRQIALLEQLATRTGETGTIKIWRLPTAQTIAVSTYTLLTEIYGSGYIQTAQFTTDYNLMEVHLLFDSYNTQENVFGSASPRGLLRAGLLSPPTSGFALTQYDVTNDRFRMDFKSEPIIHFENYLAIAAENPDAGATHDVDSALLQYVVFDT